LFKLKKWDFTFLFQLSTNQPISLIKFFLLILFLVD
jgi:hypothetical protein